MCVCLNGDVPLQIFPSSEFYVILAHEINTIIRMEVYYYSPIFYLQLSTEKL